MTKDELRTMLEDDMQEVLAKVIAASDGRDLKLTAIEDMAMEARQEFGKRVAERLLEQQVDRHKHELPQDRDGKNLHAKGKKRKRSSHVQGR